MEINVFQRIVWEHYDQGRRDMPWRLPEPDGSFDPYKIWLSEMMLQQTQVDRVIPKFEAFIKEFPGFEQLAAASFQQVLAQWQGLGYNRRAKYLHDTAKALANKPFPRTVETLTQYKGIGHNTAAAILVYSFNQPEVYVETNIRTVYLHHFFSGQTAISDTAILEKVAQTLDKKRPREWYLALMDYGSFLKKTGVRNIAKSKHYTKQSTFEGSTRQLRGKVLKLLANNQGKMPRNRLEHEANDARLDEVLRTLEQEELLVQMGDVVRLP